MIDTSSSVINFEHRQFSNTIWAFYREYGRSFDWRHIDDPYKVMVSEIMLQQTQTSRVIEKYEQFIGEFPTIYSLATAPLRDVLSVWQGLGYNRRGLYLHQAAQKIVKEYEGRMPADPEKLFQLPGIGKATAASICAFAFNMPTVFIETNIRAVYIHFFFSNLIDVHDKDIFPLVAVTVDNDNPREWYYALMDYGVMLKRITINPSRKSAHHVRQSKFEGSDRQIRGAVIRILTEQQRVSISHLLASLNKDEERVKKIIAQLCDDGLIVNCKNTLKIA